VCKAHPGLAASCRPAREASEVVIGSGSDAPIKKPQSAKESQLPRQQDRISFVKLITGYHLSPLPEATGVEQCGLRV